MIVQVKVKQNLMIFLYELLNLFGIYPLRGKITIYESIKKNRKDVLKRQYLGKGKKLKFNLDDTFKGNL